MDEQKLEQLAAELGRDAAERVQPEVMAEKVVRRLRSEPAVRVMPWYRHPAARAAALAVLAFGTIVALRGIPNRTVPVTAASEAVAPYVMDGLSAEELGDVLDSLTAERPMVEIMQVGFYDLDEEQLQRLLVSLESE